MADEKVTPQTGVVNRGNDTARRGSVTVAAGKADDSGRVASGDGSMSTALQGLSKNPPEEHAGEESMGAAAKRLKAAKAAKKPAVPSYKKGTIRVPKTGMAQLHEDEAVVPKKKADKARANGSLAALFGK